ncbi:MAG: amino acid ABC transporter permease [Clostridia bacterium]|nr:amino acid ABC transporter permease [Clostridia bacterium]
MSFMQIIVFILQKYGLSMLRGAGISLYLAFVGTAGGCVIGFICGILTTIPSSKRDNPVKRAVLYVVRLVINIYVEVFRGTPMMVQAMFIYYGVKLLWGLNLENLTAGLVIITVNTGAYMAESVRGGIISVDPGQTEGAQSIGMTHFQTMLYVIIPQALRNIMPQIGNNLIINVKDSCVLSVISVVELFFASKGAAGAYYRNFEVYTVTMVMYLIMTVSLSRLLRFVERKMDGPKNYRLAAGDQLAPTSGMLSAPKREDVRDGR